MSVDFIGMIQSQEQSEIHPPGPSGPVIDRDHVRAFAQAHEQVGLDRVLVPHHSTGPSATLTISYAAVLTEHTHFTLAHRPGFANPTLTAHQIATLDQFTGGRLGVHFISSGPDSEQRRDGDCLDHDQRYARTAEYLGILRHIWTESKPFDHGGAFYRFEQGFSEVKPARKPHVPIYFGGASDVTVEVAGRHAGVYVLWGESLGRVRDPTTRVRTETAKHGRSIRFSVSFRLILAETEDAAWARTESILGRARAPRVQQGYSRGGLQQGEGARHLFTTAEQGECVDKRLWMAVAKETGGRSNSTVLVGMPEQVTDALLDYYDLGVTTFLIRDFDPLEDVMDHGRTLIPCVRELVAQRDAQRKVA